MSLNLRGDKCPVFRQFLVDEFHFSAVFQCFDPLFVWHFRISSGEISLRREYTSFGARNRGWRMKNRPYLEPWQGEARQEQAARPVNSGCGCGWPTWGSASYENRLTMS
jgi:hypothetical protein